MPTRSGFSFQGWYESSAFTGNPVTQIPTGTNINKVFFAGWNPDISSQEKIISLSFGWSSSLAISSTGRVFNWGLNTSGQLGDATTTTRTVPTEITSRISLAAGDKIVAISLGDDHSSAISSTGRIFTWGSNSYNKLGDGSSSIGKATPTEITSRFSLAAGDKIVAISLGEYHSSAISSTGRVFTWGLNTSGQLGDATTTTRTVPTEITSRISLAAGDKIVAISLGDDHSSAISSTGRVFTWGSNSSGQLGDATTGSSNNKSIPTEITSRFNLTAGDKIVAISLGGSHSSAISSTGRVFTWGSNTSGQLGDATTTQRNIPTEITSRLNLAAGDKIVAIFLGVRHSSAISSTGRIFTWGNNTAGQLGDATTGSSNNKSIPTEITSRFNLAAGDKIVAISLGYDHSSVISSTGRVFTWGYNSSGQLGDGTTGLSNNKSIPTEIKIID